MTMPSNLTRLRVLAFSLVLVMVPFIVYYYFWISNQTTYFTGRNLRMLAALGTRVQESVESQSSVFQNAAKKYLEILAHPELGGSKNRNAVTAEQLKRTDFKEDFQKKTLALLKGEGTNLQATSLTVVPKPPDASLIAATPRIEIREESNQRWLYFDYTTAYTPNRAEEPTYLNFKGKVNLAQLIAPFVVNRREMQENQASIRQDGFDAVLVAELDDQLNILFHASAPKLRVLSLNNLTSSSGAKIDLKLLGQSTNVSDVTLGPSDYKLFVQPIELPLLRSGTDNQQALRWLACGLVESSHFQQQRLAVSYNVLIVFGFLTVLVAVSWPLIKLIFIGAKDRFRPLDAYLLGLSAFLIAALITLLALFGHAYQETENRVERDLTGFAGSIQKNFYEELESALKQIDDLNLKLDQKTLQAAQKPDTQITDKLTFRDSIMGTALVTPESPYPYFMTAFWLDGKGGQKIKWTMRSSVTNPINVSDRAYFYKLKQGPPHYYNDHEFWIEPVTSKTTGANTVVISKPVPQKEEGKEKREKKEDSLLVSAIDMRLLSLMQPVIPQGFGFAVIDDNGKVLFHSADRQHLGENFFDECDNNRGLRAAVIGRSKQTLSTSYFGKGHTMYVEPLGNFSWTVIVFHEKDSLRTTFSEILSLCLVLFIFYVVVLCVVLATIYLVNRRSRDRSTWLWPDKDKRLLYHNSLIVNTVLLMLSCFSVYLLPGLWKLSLPTLIGLTAVFLFVLRFKRAARSDVDGAIGKSKSLDYRAAYAVNVILFFCLISILPAYACFKISYLEEMRLFVKQRQLDLAEKMMNREERISGQSRFIHRNASEETIGELVEKRIAEKRDVYDAFFFDTLQSRQAAPATYTNARSDWLMPFFKDFVPLFDHSSIQRHALIRKSADNSWDWDLYGDKLVLHAREPQKSGRIALERRIESRLPLLGGALWWVVVPGVFVLVSLLLRYVIQELFLFAREESACDELTGFCVNSVSQNLLLVLSPPFIGKRQLLERMGLKEATRIDVEKVTRLKNWLRRADLLNPNGGPIILDNFESGIDDINHNQRKLSLLEALHARRRMTVALSTVDPESFLTSNGHNGDTNGSVRVAPPALLSERWNDAVSRFLKVAPEDLGNSESFKAGLDQSKRKILERDDLDKKAKARIESAFAMIERECSPRAYLQNIGEAIASQRNISSHTTGALCRQILSNAMPYYNAVWKACSDEEKLTLSRLAQYGLLSPKDPDTETLLKRGLIVRDPAIRIMNESFRMFILSMKTGKSLADCEKRAMESSSWEALKVPLTIGLLSIAVFMLLTQRELYNSALPFITGLAAGLPSFLKLISFFSFRFRKES